MKEDLYALPRENTLSDGFIVTIKKPVRVLAAHNRTVFPVRNNREKIWRNEVACVSPPAGNRMSRAIKAHEQTFEIASV